MAIFGKKKSEVESYNEITVMNALKKGDMNVKLSALIFGFGNIVNKQIIKGLLFLLVEVAYIAYMIFVGGKTIVDFITLGTKVTGSQLNPETNLMENVIGDNSMLCLLYGVVTIFITAAFILFWREVIKSAYNTYLLKQRGKEIPSFIDDIKSLFDTNLHKTLMALPLIGIVVFTVMPLFFMILMAFTNYDRDHPVPGKLFDWVGLENFGRIFNAQSSLGRTFWPVLGWTIVWAIFATFLNYIMGMVLAIIINREGTKLKAMWRFIFVLTIAVPQFVSLLIIRTMLQPDGAVNVLLRNLGLQGQSDYLPFFADVTWARVTIIIVNLWVGIPYTMLQCTGILQNIPAELYESAKVDGANAVITFFKITLPYMLFVTAPNLITSFIGNINNFNVIFLLSGGQPSCAEYYKGTAGKTDLLVTWLYKITINNKDYNLGAVIGILTFVICATVSLIVYRNTGSYKNEEEFQ